MQIWIFGNPDLEMDSLPIKIMDDLKAQFPKHDFLFKDPNDSWENLPSKLVIIDTIMGIEKVTTFTSLEDFQNVPRLSMHDFDLGTKLKWLQKIKKLPPFVIIGIPMGVSVSKILDDVNMILKKIK